ncbi:MAG: tetratricopeptide repeat protein [Chloroflexi bacterium]|nr:tetratricopeptide repeat protein [Chloroflexota bacterium]
MSEIIAPLEAKLTQAQTKIEKVDAYNNLIEEIWLQDLQRGLNLCQEAYSLASTHPPYPMGLANALMNRGRLHYRLAKYDKAQNDYLRALALYQKLEQPDKVATVWTHLGLIHWRLADYPLAADYHMKAVELSRTHQDPLGEALALGNLGLVYGITGAYEATLETYQKLLTLHRQNRHRVQEGFALNNLAMASWQMLNLAQAQEWAAESLAIAREERHQVLEVLALDTIGCVYLAGGKGTQALSYFEESATLATERGYQHEALTALLNMGKAYTLCQQPTEALSIWHKALALATTIGVKDELRDCHQQLAQHYKSEGDTAAALTHYEQFHALDRTIYNETADMRLKTLQVIHAMETAHIKNAALEQEITERRQIETALRATQETLQTLIQASPDSIYFKDGGGHWLIANQAGLQVFQLENVAYQGLTDVQLADHTSFFREALHYCAKTDEATWQSGHATRSTEIIPQPNGPPRVFDAIKVPLFTDNGERKGLVIIGREITAQYETEIALRQSEGKHKAVANLMRLMCDNVPDLIWAKDMNGHFLFTNQAMCTKLLNAQDTDEPIGKTDLFFAQRERTRHSSNPEWHTFGEICINSDDVILEQRIPQRFDEFGNVQGKFLYLDVYKAPFWNEHGEMIGTVGCGRVVTAEKQQEAENKRIAQALQLSEERLRRIVQHMPIMIDALDNTGNIVFWNEECERVTGYSAAEIIGNPNAFTLIYPDPIYRQKMLQIWAEYGDEYRDWEWEMTCKDGTIRTIAWSNISNQFPVPGWAAWGIGVDVTERQKAELALRQTQKTESLGVLAGGIAHDFNNLLVAILGQMSLAQIKMRPESQARTHVEKAVKAAERAADLTQKMLAYSGRGHFSVEPMNLNALISENLHLFEASIPKNVQLYSDLTSNLPLIEADAGQMQQVVMNLIINGVEAIGDQSGRVLVATGVENIDIDNGHYWHYAGTPLAPGTYVTLEIHDTGCGMNQATLNKIFDPFFTTKQTGHGLGLAAVLGIMRGHHGGIYVYTEPGRGTTFKLLFPIPITPTETVMLDTTHHSLTIQTALVLVIDDEEPVCTAISDILASEGIHTLVATNGHAGLTLYQAHQNDIHLVILDLSMPGLSGEETFRHLHRINPEVRVMLSSGYSQVEATSRFTGKGLVAFIQKPYAATTLLQKVKQVL